MAQQNKGDACTRNALRLTASASERGPRNRLVHSVRALEVDAAHAARVDGETHYAVGFAVDCDRKARIKGS